MSSCDTTTTKKNGTDTNNHNKNPNVTQQTHVNKKKVLLVVPNIHPPKLTSFTKHIVIAMVPCFNGSIQFYATGIGIPDPNMSNDTSKFTDVIGIKYENHCKIMYESNYFVDSTSTELDLIPLRYVESHHTFVYS